MNVSSEAYVCVIGAAGVDLAGHSYAAVVPAESNPGRLHVSFGGVGRNIAENLARLDVPVCLVTVLADDEYGRQMALHAEKSGIRLEALVVEGAGSPGYLSVVDPQGELVVAVSDMELLDQFTVGFIRENTEIIQNATLCVIDANLTPEVIRFLFEHFSEANFCVDLVSVAKAGKFSPWLQQISVIKPNRAEAAQLSGIPITDHNSLRRVTGYFLKKEIDQVFISLGDEGVFYSDGLVSGTLSAESDSLPVNTMGAGDAMMAGLVFSLFHGLDLEQTAYTAMAASQLAVEHRDAVNPNISTDTLMKAKEKIHHA